MRYGNISEQFGVTGKINISVKEDSETIMESLLHAEELALISPTWSEKRKKTFVMGDWQQNRQGKVMELQLIPFCVVP